MHQDKFYHELQQFFPTETTVIAELGQSASYP